MPVTIKENVTIDITNSIQSITIHRLLFNLDKILVYLNVFGEIPTVLQITTKSGTGEDFVKKHFPGIVPQIIKLRGEPNG